VKKFYTIFVVFFLILLLSSSGIAQNLLTEDFNYTSGTLLSTHGWTFFSGTDGIAVTTPGLSYANVGTYEGSGIGNAVTLSDAVTAYDSKLLSASVFSGSVYCSAMINVSDATNTTGDNLISLCSGNSLFYANVFVRKDPTSGFDFGVSKVATGPSGGQPPSPTFTSSGYSFGTTYLVVVKYTFNTATHYDDQVVLYVNPVVGGAEPGTPTLTAGDNATSYDLNSPIDNVCLHKSTATPTATIDGIKVATTWADLPMPVELSSFSSNVNGRNVSLIWQTKTEKNSDKFVIEREAIGATWEAIGSVKAAVLSNSPKNYSYSDTKLQSGKYQYRLKMVDNDGSFSYSSIEAAEVAVPKDFAVSQNYPNPFNPSTKIDYQVPVDAKVILEVYNIAGQKVVELVNQEQSAGYYTVDFGASKLSSGVYIYRIVASDKATGNNFSSIKKMMLLK
jgi:hypothetical protein